MTRCVNIYRPPSKHLILALRRATQDNLIMHQSLGEFRVFQSTGRAKTADEMRKVKLAENAINC